MKERPIIFSGPMVQAILTGKKTQTRRVVKPQPPSPATLFALPGMLPYCLWPSDTPDETGNHPDHGVKFPYGFIGDRLWVRETWGLWDTEPSDGPEKATILYKSSDKVFTGNPRYQLWRSPMFMPRWASRITLEITGVRVERLQDISEADANAEGAKAVDLFCPEENYYPPGTYSYREGYAELWDSLNGKKHPWESNPWVWVLEFKRIEEGAK